jgi:hypothetical protein
MITDKFSVNLYKRVERVEVMISLIDMKQAYNIPQRSQ